MRHDPLNTTLTQSQPSAPAATPAAAPAKLKKVSLGGIAKAKTDGASSQYPTYPDPEKHAAALAERIAKRNDQFEALKSALEVDKAELSRVLIRPWYFRHYHGRTGDIPSSVLVKYGGEPIADTHERTPIGTVRVTVKDQYNAFPDESVFTHILGDRTGEFFRQSFSLKIDGDKIPANKAGELVEKLQQLFADYDCSDALEAKECILPVPDFKSLRFTKMTVDESLALENVGDKGLTQTMVSTKNTRK